MIVVAMGGGMWAPLTGRAEAGGSRSWPQVPTSAMAVVLSGVQGKQALGQLSFMSLELKLNEAKVSPLLY